MRQILSSLKTGATQLADVPVPTVEPGQVLIRTRRSLVSPGTERMLVNFGKASLLQKARSQPDKVKQVLAKIRSEGLLPTIEAVFRRLDEPLPLGYCNTGVVVGVGAGVTGFAIGDRVASNGPHAEYVAVPVNLCARVPTGVDENAAAFTVLGAIALQGIRLAAPTLGETVVVMGLGLVGQLTVQLLQAAGCRVIGFDPDVAKVRLAAANGASALCNSDVDVVRHITDATGGLGADAVIITASTASNDVIAQSAQMSRKRGRVVLVGVVGLDLNRADFYAKELTFQVSCSYGPGRYDDVYEDKGYDYPPAYVRWTEQRNFEAVLEALRTRRLQVDALVTRRVPLERCAEIYNDMDAAGLASLIEYPAEPSNHAGGPGAVASGRVAVAPIPPGAATVVLTPCPFTPADGALAVIGAGNFTQMTALPALAAAGAVIKTIVSAGGVSGTALAKKYGISQSSTDLAATLADPDIRGVIVTTRHHQHAAQAIAALAAGKHVLVEKPLCLRRDELRAIEAALRAAGDRFAPPPTLTVGFNRRFSPHVARMKELLTVAPAPVAVVATMNAGAIPAGHWVHDPEIGGGRLVGEACHFVDLAIHLTGSLVEAVSATALAGGTDSASILLRHANGSVSVVNYLANGNRALSKERIEAHSGGCSLVLDNFRTLRGFGFKRFTKLETRQDKGHAAQFARFAAQMKAGGSALIPWGEVANATLATLAVPVALAERRWVELTEE